MRAKQVELEFPDKGLVLVQGVNTASGGALQSVGSGKSSLGEAISRTLLGVPGRFPYLKRYSTHKKGDLYVKLETELRGKPLTVEHGFACQELSPDSEALRYSYDGKKDVERGTIQETRDQLSKLIGVSPLLASWTVFIDGDSIKFNKLSQADCVDLVMASLRQPAWSSLHEVSKKFAGKFRKVMTETQTTHQGALVSFNEATEQVAKTKETLATVQADYEQAIKDNQLKIKSLTEKIATKNEQIGAAKTEMEAIEKKFKKMEQTRAEASHQLEIQLHEVEDALQLAQEERQPLSEARINTQAKAAQAKSTYDSYLDSPKSCPVCARPFPGIDQKRLKRLKEEWTKAKAIADKAQGAWAKTEQKVVDLDIKYRATAKAHREASAKSDVDAMADRHEELSQAVSDALNEVHQIELEAAKLAGGPSDSAVKIAETRYEDAVKARKKAKSALEAAASALADDRTTMQVIDYWNTAFGPYGIPNMILKEAVAPLNKEARRISAAMTGGTIEVRYSTSRELTSGLEKAVLNIEVDNKLGDKDLNGSSKGEAGLTNFIVAETLSEVGQVSRRIGYRFYDEIVPHQDPKVCHSIYAYMKDLAERLDILVFLVDHNPIAANYADHILIVEKSQRDGDAVTDAHWR